MKIGLTSERVREIADTCYAKSPWDKSYGELCINAAMPEAIRGALLETARQLDNNGHWKAAAFVRRMVEGIEP